MNENEKTICPKCGKEMIPLDNHRTVGMTCPNCGWEWVTSYFEPYETDPTQYSVVIFGNEINTQIIKTVSEITGENYIKTREILLQPEAVVFEGRATDIFMIRDKLNLANISFKIKPDFPY